LRQRLSIAECAKRTHVIARYLEALEEEHWQAMPSESHREGFLKLYCRFLGISPEEAMSLYRENRSSAASAGELPSPRATRPTAKAQWEPVSGQQIGVLIVVLLLLMWVLYHLFGHQFSEQRSRVWFKSRRSQHTRLVQSKARAVVQHVVVRAEKDSWMRVIDNREMIFEGILPAGATKEWKGPGPFTIKLGDVRAVSVYWNEQPIDVTVGAHGIVNALRLPPLAAPTPATPAPPEKPSCTYRIV
jgi:hypothetical protein